MFSARTRWDLAPNRLADAARRGNGRRARGSSTSRSRTRRGPGITYPRTSSRRSRGARRGATSRCPSACPRRARRSARDFARRGCPVPPSAIAPQREHQRGLRASCSSCCATPATRCWCPRPGYPLFDFLAGARVGPRCERTRSRTTAQWHLDLGARLAALVGPRTRAIVVVSPNNPTGAFLKRRRARGARGALRRARRWPSSQTRCSRLRAPPGRAARRECRRATAPALAFALGGLSKSCGLPQLKLAWTAVVGPRAAAARGAGPARGRGRQLPVGLDARAGRGARAARARGRAAGPDPRRACAANLRARARARRARPSRDACSSRRAAGPPCCACRRRCTEEERVLRLLDERDVLVHPGLLLRLPARGLPRAEPAAAARRLRRGRRAGCSRDLVL